ncbi:hypothetical protein HOLleu_03764 [Holothuria leucospilota]|uniref:Uncharacterized protein n=1 Tax=Holothuria leucospilota TaxID=206669 RepID=A0A9Q1CTT9_HOLLE|nr:hypothetical protein HOLleu_03764 [Holothuria leucospilota]
MIFGSEMTKSTHLQIRQLTNYEWTFEHLQIHLYTLNIHLFVLAMKAQSTNSALQATVEMLVIV